MVNHFASLLGNFNLTAQKLSPSVSVLGDTDLEPDISISTDGVELISLDEEYMSLRYVKTFSKLINRNYVPINLPQELSNFYNLLFPESASLYYKQFLLYTYLRLIDSTEMADQVLKFDSRLSYNLKEMQEYFKFSRNSKPVSSDPSYYLNLLGSLKPSDTLNYYLNNFVVRQLGSSTNILIFSTTEALYHKPGKFPSKKEDDMQSTLVLDTEKGSSKLIQVGDTGLSFFISGPFNDLELGFTNTSNKTWSFTAETELVFDFNQKANTLNFHHQIVEGMLSFNHNKSDVNYENIWRTHHNSFYRFVAILMAYVNRVHTLWLQQT